MHSLEHCGPITRPGMKVAIDGKGIALSTDIIDKIAAKPGQWVARWIWLDEAEFPDFQEAPHHAGSGGALGLRVIALFRKEIDLTVVPKDMAGWVTASSKYRLYINGRMVGRGPAEHGGDIDDLDPPAWWFYDPIDLAGLLHEGRNVITAEVSLFPEVGADYSLGHGGFLFEARVIHDPGRVIIATDGTWRARVDDARLVKAMHDAREDPGPWHGRSFDASTWPAAAELSPSTCERWRLVAREIPPLMEARVAPATASSMDHGRHEKLQNLCSPVPMDTTISPGKPVSFSLDFDREVVGYLQFCVTAPAGVELLFGYQERRGKDDDSDLYITKAGLQAHEAMRLRCFQHLRVVVDFKNVPPAAPPLVIHSIGINFTSYPVQYKGEFSCSEPILDKIWLTGRWTEQLCMQAYHLDSPIHQEPLGDTGDYMIESLIDYACFGDVRLARQDLLRTAWLLQHKHCIMFHTSYSLLFVQMLRDYHDHAGDTALVQDLMPTVHALLERFHGYVGESGLITEAPNYMFMDWVTVDSYNLHHPPCVIGQGYMSVFYYQALQNAAELCIRCQDKAGARTFEARAKEMKAAFNKELWVPSAGLYCDGLPNLGRVPPGRWMPPDPGKIYFSRHTNAVAVACGMAPVSQAKGIMDKVLHDPSLPVVQPYFMHYVFDALAAADLFDKHGIGEMRRWKAILDEHPSSWKESWGMGDYSHAWSGTPTYQLSARVLGVSPGAPGFATVVIHPHPGDLAWARGTVPTPAGPVKVHWSITGKIFALDVEAPESSWLQVVFPLGYFTRPGIWERDRVIWRDGVVARAIDGIESLASDGARACLGMRGGSYRFRVQDAPERA